MRCVLKCAFEVLGCGGWISSGYGFGGGGEEDVGAGTGFEDVGCSWVIEALLMAVAVEMWSSEGGDDTVCSFVRFLIGDSDGLVGDGELDKKNGRLRIGELDISGRLVEGGVGCESGMTLGGVCQESDCVRRRDGVA